jgi:branched-chain amino acid aminotransferase
VGRVDDIDNNKSYSFSKDGEPGPVSTKLYNKLRAIQNGEEPDPYGWTTIID